jgi:hypothetical protein
VATGIIWDATGTAGITTAGGGTAGINLRQMGMDAVHPHLIMEIKWQI